MARPAQALWQLAYDLHAHEPLVQEWRAGSGVRDLAACSDRAREDRGGVVGQHDRQGASRWHRGVKKAARRPSASPGADGRPRFIWLPRMRERP